MSIYIVKIGCLPLEIDDNKNNLIKEISVESVYKRLDNCLNINGVQFDKPILRDHFSFAKLILDESIVISFKPYVIKLKIRNNDFFIWYNGVFYVIYTKTENYNPYSYDLIILKKKFVSILKKEFRVLLLPPTPLRRDFIFSEDPKFNKSPYIDDIFSIFYKEPKEEINQYINDLIDIELGSLISFYKISNISAKLRKLYDELLLILNYITKGINIFMEHNFFKKRVLINKIKKDISSFYEKISEYTIHQKNFKIESSKFIDLSKDSLIFLAHNKGFQEEGFYYQKINLNFMYTTIKWAMDTLNSFDNYKIMIINTIISSILGLIIAILTTDRILTLIFK